MQRQSSRITAGGLLQPIGTQGKEAGVKEEGIMDEWIKNMDKKYLRVIAWNVRSHKQRRTTVTIKKLLESNNVIMIQETKLKEKPSYGDQNKVYFKPSQEKGNAKRGLLTITRASVDSCETPTPRNNKGVETQAVSIQCEGKQYVCVNVYVPGEVMTKADDWTSVLNPLLTLGQRVVISGDLNARSPMWKDVAYKHQWSHTGGSHATDKWHHTEQ